MHHRDYVLGLAMFGAVVIGCAGGDRSELTNDVQTTTDDLRARCKARDPRAKSKCVATCTPWGDDDDDDDDTPRVAPGCDGGAPAPSTDAGSTTTVDAAPPPPPPPPPPTSTVDASAPPPPPATCTSFTYSAWGACQPNGPQTRTVLSSSPSGCTGGSPITTQACTYIDGAALYTQYCAGCHGTSKKGSSATSISNAIAKNTGGMGSLSFLTSAQIAAISAAP